jgi:hypothetical protein
MEFGAWLAVLKKNLGASIFYVADGGFGFLSSFGAYLSNCVVSYLRRTQSSYSHI